MPELCVNTHAVPRRATRRQWFRWLHDDGGRMSVLLSHCVCEECSWWSSLFWSVEWEGDEIEALPL